MSDESSSWPGRLSTRVSKMLERPPRLDQFYFEDVLAIEFASINDRRQTIRERDKVGQRTDVAPLTPVSDAQRAGSVSALAAPAPQSPAKAKPSRISSPNKEQLFEKAARLRKSAAEAETAHAQLRADSAEIPHPPSAQASPYDKSRPQPVPCDATGMAFSGGGIRSAAVCLGALQAFESRRLLDSVDYLSTVSGGGYIGSCLSAATCSPEGRPFPFGDDVLDSSAVAHLRNYSNYLLPRGRSSLTNFAEAGAVVLRGLVANFVIVLGFVLICVLATLRAFPDFGDLDRGSFLPRLLDSASGSGLNALLGAYPFQLTFWWVGLLVVSLLTWAALRSQKKFDPYTDDNRSPALAATSVLLIAALALAFLDLQPLAIKFTAHVHYLLAKRHFSLAHLGVAISALSGAVSVFSGSLGGFLKASEHATDWTTIGLRIATQIVVAIAALVLPVAIWVAYLELTLRGMSGAPNSLLLLGHEFKDPIHVYWIGLAIAAIVFLTSQANGYSLHRFYRDRLSKAFLFVPPKTGRADSTPLDAMKLTKLRESTGPYHIVNSALNVEGSKEANRRGRNADFFMLTRDFVGSDLTRYARTEAMEPIDARLDVATAMAISGAAVSANMGSSTTRLLSPTLALLNIRLGYWLHNPLHLATATEGWSTLARWLTWPFGKLYLLGEMFNLLDETSRNILLTDGGHIENLGVYELLKRGCQLIFVVDAEADPSLAFPALLTLERYARIDLGVRINLPWDEIAAMSKSVDASKDDEPVCANGPHCAVGRILYQTGEQGIIVYIKSSLSGDEKDYVLDYKKRYASFPHETTGDQFFSEEQFEVYRALGYHMVEGLFSGSDQFSFQSTGPGAFADSKAAIIAIRAMLAPTAKAWVAN
jgi:hypothetical protein